jgi:hypothetical protein
MTILRIQFAYQRFPKLNLSFPRILVRACLEEHLFIIGVIGATGPLIVRRMRPTPGRVGRTLRGRLGGLPILR